MCPLWLSVGVLGLLGLLLRVLGLCCSCMRGWLSFQEVALLSFFYSLFVSVRLSLCVCSCFACCLCLWLCYCLLVLWWCGFRGCSFPADVKQKQKQGAFCVLSLCLGLSCLNRQKSLKYNCCVLLPLFVFSVGLSGLLARSGY